MFPRVLTRVMGRRGRPMLGTVAANVFTGAPSQNYEWLLPGATLDMDFTRGYYWANGITPLANMLTTTRASTGYAQDSGGTFYSFGNNIPRITDKGLLVEEARTNVVLWCRDLTNAAWTKTNVTAALDQVGIDGTANSASSIVATAGNGTCLQAITLGSTARWQSAWVKRITGSGTVNMTMDNGATWTAVTVTAGWTLVSIPTQTLANPTVGFRIVTNGDKIAVDFVQNEASGTLGTSPILTTTVAVTRAADRVTLSSPSLVTRAAGTTFTEWQELAGPIATSNRLWRFGTAGSAISAIDARSNSGSDKVANNAFDNGGASICGLVSTNSVVAGTIYRNAFAYALNDFASAYTASLQATVVTDASGDVGAGVPAAVEIGQSNGASFLNGYLRRLAWSPNRVPNAQLLAWAQAQ